MSSIIEMRQNQMIALEFAPCIREFIVYDIGKRKFITDEYRFVIDSSGKLYRFTDDELKYGRLEEVDRGVVPLMYTNIKDVNGNKIYERAFLEHPSERKIGEVYYSKSHSCFMIHWIQFIRGEFGLHRNDADVDMLTKNFCLKHNLIVVGNAYGAEVDNKEILSMKEILALKLCDRKENNNDNEIKQ